MRWSFRSLKTFSVYAFCCVFACMVYCVGALSGGQRSGEEEWEKVRIEEKTLPLDPKTGKHFTLDYPAGLWRWFHKGEYTGSEIERRFVEVWFRWLLHYYKGTFHMSPDISFHQGIVQIWKEDAYIDDEELKLRKLDELERRLRALEGKELRAKRNR